MTGHLIIFTVAVLLSSVCGADDVVRLSVIEGDSVTLHINPDEIQGAYDLMWFFNNDTKFIARVEKEINKISTPGNTEERFRDRLQVDQNGSLTITDVRTTNAGLYKLEISRSSGISYKSFNVTVSDQGSHWLITGLVLAVVLLLVLLVVSVLIYKHYRKRDEML